MWLTTIQVLFQVLAINTSLLSLQHWQSVGKIEVRVAQITLIEIWRRTLSKIRGVLSRIEFVDV